MCSAPVISIFQRRRNSGPSTRFMLGCSQPGSRAITVHILSSRRLPKPAGLSRKGVAAHTVSRTTLIVPDLWAQRAHAWPKITPKDALTNLLAALEELTSLGEGVPGGQATLSEGSSVTSSDGSSGGGVDELSATVVSGRTIVPS